MKDKNVRYRREIWAGHSSSLWKQGGEHGVDKNKKIMKGEVAGKALS